jgi:hypothetical protein
MPTTPNLSFPFIESGQAQKHVTHNEALRLLDAVTQLAVVSVSASPPGEPLSGERHIVGASASGAFAGHENEIAAFQDGGWVFLAPRSAGAPGTPTKKNCWSGPAAHGVRCPRAAEAARATSTARTAALPTARWRCSTARPARQSKPAAARSRILASARRPTATDTDTSNRLVVKASRAVFYAREDAETPGTGDIKIQISKEAEGNSASFFFSTNFSGRAEFGLVEGDSFLLKVSDDGSAWVEALTVDPASGKVRLPENDVADIVLLADQAAYDALDPPDESTLYLIPEEE